MKGHLFWIVVWIGLVIAGYLVTERMMARPPMVRSLGDGRQELVIPVSRDGHYYLDGAINGLPLRFMIDTGASYVAVGAEFARAAGLPDGIPGYFSTANGTVEGPVVRSQTVKAGVFELSGLTVAVMPAHDGEGLLGQNFLRHFDVSQAGGAMRLRMREQSSRRGLTAIRDNEVYPAHLPATLS
ncbi:MAG TPA: retropepsin-like aspartic protease [Burkholderiales bacterium]|nr:retropepsin-like aspartic protease [Burkholderiales bacterium]